MRTFRNGPRRIWKCKWMAEYQDGAAYTTLLGLESLNSLTPTAIMHMPMSSFHSPAVMRNPPGGYGVRRDGTCLGSSLAASLRWSASRISVGRVGKRCVEGTGWPPKAGEGGLRARKLPDILGDYDKNTAKSLRHRLTVERGD